MSLKVNWLPEFSIGSEDEVHEPTNTVALGKGDVVMVMELRALEERKMIPGVVGYRRNGYWEEPKPHSADVALSNNWAESGWYKIGDEMFYHEKTEVLFRLTREKLN